MKENERKSMGRCLPSHDVVFVFCNFDVLRGNARKFRNKIYRIKLMGWGMGSDVDPFDWFMHVTWINIY